MADNKDQGVETNQFVNNEINNDELNEQSPLSEMDSFSDSDAQNLVP